MAAIIDIELGTGMAIVGMYMDIIDLMEKGAAWPIP